MKIIISPAKTFKIKKMKLSNKDLLFEKKTGKLVSMLKGKTLEELRNTWKCSENIANEGFELYDKFELSPKGCAIASFCGLQYQYMDIESFNRDDIDFLEEHLRIMSGLYGILRPLDEISKYRLDFEDKFINMYEYWEKEIKDHFKGEDIIDLASKEYGENIYKYFDKIPLKIDFKEEVCSNGSVKLKTKATSSKILRGRMVNFIAKNKVRDTEKLKEFSCDGYFYSQKQSKNNRFVFVKSLK
ncbi:YaaA family protein [uncultured Finegoldia sp.]|uniref:YaaA family protein n=1 Tax=uncultured Finegoldia sp. TaxID=328009 RepID=UPI00261F120A|nr:YaaA family protein [uncultured Finegoldia sp.]